MLTHNQLFIEVELTFYFQSTFSVGVSFFTLYHLSLSSFPPSFSRFLLPSEAAEGQLSAEEEEARRIAEMGKPILGEHSRLEVVIEESYEFKVHHQCFLFYSKGSLL